MTSSNNFLEIETKYDATDIDRIEFKKLLRSLPYTGFLYVESRDVYYTKNDSEFLRYRMPSESSKDPRSELTFKKKHAQSNNIVRTEVNVRTDNNSPETIEAFCNTLGFHKNFSIMKYCDIFFFENEANVVYYTVIDDFGKYAHFVEIEACEEVGFTEDEAWEVITKYEKLLSPLGISAQKRKRLSLFEMYVR